jgi:PH (Pleckstrin Homology) domain-containing protein
VRPRPPGDPLPPDTLAPAQARFVPDRRYTALAAGGAFGALIAVLVTDDAGGRLLLVLAVVVLLGYVASDLFFSPRLVASAEGVVVNSPMTRARLSWDEVHEVRAETRIRRGLRNTTLEVDAGPVLVVLSRRALGADPVDVAELVEAFRPR